MTKTSELYKQRKRGELENLVDAKATLEMLERRINSIISNFYAHDFTDYLGEMLNHLDLAQATVAGKIEEIEGELKG